MSKYVGNILTDGAATGYSCGFSGSSTYLSVANNSAFALTGDFTIEFWAYLPSVSSAYGFIGYGTTTSGWNLINDSSRWVFKMMNGSDNNVFVQDGTATTNSWQHYAISSSSGTVKFFINGFQIATGTAVSSTPASGSLTIGYGYSTSYSLPTGSFLSNVRIVKGTALYTAAFTPPTQLFAITNTSLLTCQQPTIIDTSSNAFAITNTGGVTVSNFSPFPAYQAIPTGPYLYSTAPGLWKLNDAAYFVQQGNWPTAGNVPADPYFNNVSLLLTGDGTNGAQNNTFLDSSSNAFTITRNGNTTQGTFSPYGSLWSNYFVDSSSSYLNIASSSIVNFGTGDFTAEAWVNLNAINTSIDTIISNYNNGSNGGLGWYINRGTNGGIQVYSGNSLVVSASSAVTAGTWNHIAICRASGTTRIFVNGAVAASASDSNNYGADNTATGIGGTPPSSGAGAYLPGYLSNVRVVKGTALYTSNFTPSTTPLTAVSGTSLLTCQSNRFIDNSSNNFTLTVNGNTSVQRFSPFNPTAPYSAATIGGSGYFDGAAAPNTDKLVIANNSALDLGTGDFTIECWVYSTTAWTSYTLEYAHILGKGNGNASGTYALAGYQSKIYFSGIQGSTTLPANAWCHLAVSRSSSTVRLFVNGVLDASGTISTDYTNSESFNIGDRKDSDPAAQYPFNGYMSNLRIVKGTAIYTSNFTPPTAPVTAVSGTSLLTNFTNAGIPDAAMMNDLETVGNAQVSTSVVKYGTGSLAFDGTGDYLYSLSQPLGTGNFTVEFWLYPNSFKQYGCFFDTRTVNTNASGLYIRNGATYSSGQWGAGNGDNSFTITASSNLTATTWQHVALVRNGTTITLYKDGTSVGSATSSQNFSDLTTWVGGAVDGYQSSCYIDDLRITNGIARYTANFTPPAYQFATY